MSEEKLYWAELIPTMCGLSVGLTWDTDNNPSPSLCDTKQDVLDEIEDMQRLMQLRDPSEEWDGECHRVSFDGENLFLLDEENGEKLERIDWREQL